MPRWKTNEELEFLKLKFQKKWYFANYFRNSVFLLKISKNGGIGPFWPVLRLYLSAPNLQRQAGEDPSSNQNLEPHAACNPIKCWVCSKLKPIIFCCKAQVHALEFFLASVGIFGRNKILNHPIFSQKNIQLHLLLFCKKYLAACSINSFVFASPFSL